MSAMREISDAHVTVAAEAIEEVAIRRIGRDLGTVNRDEIVRAGLEAFAAVRDPLVAAQALRDAADRIEGTPGEPDTLWAHALAAMMLRAYADDLAVTPPTEEAQRSADSAGPRAKAICEECGEFGEGTDDELADLTEDHVLAHHHPGVRYDWPDGAGTPPAEATEPGVVSRG